MKRFYFIVVLCIILFSSSSAQVINFGKTLPVSAFSFTVAPVYNIAGIYHPNIDGLSYMVMGGYGIGYDIDVSIKYGTSHSFTREDGIVNSPDFFAIDFQYLFRETRKNYYSLFGGIHKWDEYGIDLTFSYTYTPQYNINLSAGIDIDVDVTNTRSIPNYALPEVRAWVPLNFGYNFDDRVFIFFEYNLPFSTQASWDIIAGGITFIFR